MRKSLKRIVKHRRKRSSSSSSSSRTYRKKHSHSKRNRKQRGGKTKEELYIELRRLYTNGCLDHLNKQMPLNDEIVQAFEQLNFNVNDPASCIKFKQLLRIRDESSKRLLYSDSDINNIERTETAHMIPIMQKYGLYTPDSLTNWINFVKYMNRRVTTLASAQSAQPTSMVHAVPVQAQDALPVGWIQRTDDDGRTYYVDHGGKSTQWEKPVLPAGWSEKIDATSGRTYYWSRFNKSQWEKPTEEALPEGWKRSGPDHAPIYFNSITGHSQYEVPTMSASAAALAKRLVPNLPAPILTGDQLAAKLAALKDD
jgi:hypothetical protein